MARRTNALQPLQITADELPGVTIFNFASLSDGSLDPIIRAHKALSEFKTDGCEWGLRAALQECELTESEIDETIAVGTLPAIGVGWTPAMAAHSSRSIDTALANLRALAASNAIERKASALALAA